MLNKTKYLREFTLNNPAFLRKYKRVLEVNGPKKLKALVTPWLKAPEKWQIIVGFDYETDLIGQHVEYTVMKWHTCGITVTAFNPTDFSHKEIYSAVFFSSAQIRAFLRDLIERFTKRQITMIAHNISFDIRFLLYDLLREDFVFQDGSKESHFTALKKWWLTLRHKYSGTTLRLVDSMRFFNFSLKKVGMIIGIHKKDVDAGKEDFAKMTPEQIEYVKQDSRIPVYAIIWFFKQIAEISERMGNVIMFDFEKNYPSGNSAIARNFMTRFSLNTQQMDIKQHEKIVNNESMLFGGKTEAETLGRIGNCEYIDLKSAYPATMVKEQFPKPFANKKYKRHLGKPHSDVSEDNIAVRQMVIIEKSHYPLFPVKFMKKNFYPAGKKLVWVFRKEYDYMLAHPELFEIVSTKQWFECDGYDRPYLYLQKLYDMRAEMKKNNNPAEYADKVILNSGYGMLGQAEFGKLVNVIHASIITAYVRLSITSAENMLFEAGFHVAYSDTDSLVDFTAAYEYMKKIGLIGHELGNFEIEKSMKNLWIQGPKEYEYEKEDGGMEVTFKGVRHAKGIFNVYFNGQTQIQMLPGKPAMDNLTRVIGGKSFNELGQYGRAEVILHLVHLRCSRKYLKKKSIDSYYSQRKITDVDVDLKIIHTVPWDMDELHASNFPVVLDNQHKRIKNFMLLI